METCPGPDVWFTLGEGTDPDLDRHLDRCAECRSVAAAIARLGVTDAEIVDDSHAVGLVPELVPAGTVLDRYVVRGAIGSGGMGVVLEAYDPQLDRTVALKVVRRLRDDATSATVAGSARAHDRVREEAKAMARLAHPNVTAIYDLIEIGDERLIAMEYVAGPDLDSWLAGRPSPAERLRAIVEAGRGLAAAHDAGVVHRDIKPSNILVGADGRARVTDFGLAALAGVAGAPATAGTPAYFAPEVAAGGLADARSDQYSFALTAWQAWFGQRPGPPRRREPPIARVLRRALATEPERRFSSMHELVRALEATTARRRRVVAAAVAGVAAIALVVVVATRARSAEPETCRPDDAAAAAVWSLARREAWKQAVAPVAGAAIEPLAAAMDGAWRHWLDDGVALCQASRRGDRIPANAAACLESARRKLAAVVQHAPAASSAAEIEAALARLDDPGACTSAPAPSQPGLDPATRETHDEIVAALDEVTALSWLGEYKAARDRLEVLAARVPRGDDALRGELLYRRADAISRSGDVAETVPMLEEALAIAERTGNDIARVNVIILLLNAYEELGKANEAGALAAIAEAAAQRIPRDATRAGRLASVLGSIAYNAARYPEAERHYREVVAIEEERAADKGGRDPALAGSLFNLGLAVHTQGRTDEATAIHRRSLAMFEATVGADHPDTALPIIELAALALEGDRLDEAGALYQRAIAIQRKALGEDHPHLSETLAGLARVEAARGRYDEALATYRRAQEIASAGFGPEHPLTALCEFRIAEELDRRGAHDLARPMIEHSVAAWEANAVDLPEAHLARFLLAQYQWRAGQRKQARALATRAHAGLARLAAPYAGPAKDVERWLGAHP